VVAPARDAEAEPQAPQLLFHNDAIGESALGYDSLSPPNARLQHVLTVEVEAEADALLLDSMAVRAPPSGGWYDPAHGCPSACCLRSSGCFRVIMRYRPCPVGGMAMQTMISADTPAAGWQAHPCPSCRRQWLVGAQSRRLQSY
jgi:hypothetical protein